MKRNNGDTINKKVSQYIDNALKLSRDYGFEEIPKEAVEKAKLEVEKASVKYQKILAHS